MRIPREILEASLLEAGIRSYGFVGEAALRGACPELPPEQRTRLGVDGSGGAIIAALPYGEGPAAYPAWVSPSGAIDPEPLARLARFARADWYAELRARLKDAAARIRLRLGEDGIDPGLPREWRYFANSRLPERRLALEAGLGRLGRHGLVMLPEQGSAVVLGLLLCPIKLESRPDSGPAPVAGRPGLLDPSCGNCRACAEACPTGALGSGHGFVRELCLQHWSSVPGPLPAVIEAAWGDRLYGCDSCQEACPRFRPDASAVTGRGLLGPGLPARWLTAASESEIRAGLRGSVLGMGWIAVDALKRNAALALRGR
ncbi:MAG: 4Fe-4S double cluster binding domain-containing protein [Rectinemataceae bacterium]